MAYEVIKRVSGRAYRYRVESFRDPETRRVRGRWTYLGRVDPADAGLPERPTKRSSRDRLLDAVARLLATTDAEALSAGAIAQEAGVAYGTFYRYFTDRAHAVREALLRRGPSLGNVAARFGQPPGTREIERERIASWLREVADVGRSERGVVRARREAVDATVDRVTAYLDVLRDAAVSEISSSRFAAYALVALVVALGRDAALEGDLREADVAGLITLAHELCGLG